MNKLENKIPPPFVALIIGAAMFGVAKTQQAIAIDPILRYAIAGFLALSAMSASASAALAFRRAKTTINPVQIQAASSLVTRGIFRFTRNPMYVGLTTLLTAWAVLLAVPWALLGPVVFALFTNRFQIIPEERVMTAKFGSEYTDYCRRVRRWL